MASIGKYRKKIKSAKNIAKVTKAMQLVAASKMRKAQASALSGKDYSNSLSSLTNIFTRYLDKTIHPLIGDALNPSAPQLIVLIAPEKGLCGALVTNISRFVAREVLKGNKSDFIIVGAKARQVAKRLQLNIVAEFPLGLSHPTYELVPPIARLAESRFIDGTNSGVRVVYAEFINTMVQEVVVKSILPLKLQEQSENLTKSDKLYLFEPTPEDIVNSLLSMYLETEIYHILLEAYASEQSARMVAMKNATDNAKGLIDDLTVEFNKVRQGMITSEILDIGNQAFINAQ